MTNIMDRPRFYGIYRGKVTDISDPLNKSRIKAVIPQVLGEAQTSWMDACLPLTSISIDGDHDETFTTSSNGTHNHAYTDGTTGSAGAHTHTVHVVLPHIKKPIIGQGIWVMFEGGDPDFPVWTGVAR